MIYDFKNLEVCEDEGNIEDYDTFRVLSDHFNDMNMFYMNGEFYLITCGENIRKIERRLLADRKFVKRNNNVKEFIAKNGQDVFSLLSDIELINVILGKTKENIER